MAGRHAARRDQVDEVKRMGLPRGNRHLDERRHDPAAAAAREPLAAEERPEVPVLNRRQDH